MGMEWDGMLYAWSFDLQTAPMIFNAVAEALVLIISQKVVDHYLDDFTKLNARNGASSCSK